MPPRDATRRSRTLQRKFVLLRFCDSLRVPRANVLRTLESSGRIKDISFSNDATAAHIQDTLLHNFSNHLTRENISR